MTVEEMFERAEASMLVECMGKPCRIWTGATSKGGYPKAHIGERYVGVHRLALESRIGRALRRTELACHRCDVPACIEPAHLYVGTPADNQRDRRRRGTANPGLCRVTLTKADVRRLYL